MLVDANLLLYAVGQQSPHHRAAAAWLESALNGDQRVAIPWQCIGTFLRIVTHPRITVSPLSSVEAMSFVNSWLETDAVWIPQTTERTVSVLSELMIRYHLTGNLVPDAQLAALAI